MRVIKDGDIRVFTDTAGDTLVLLTRVRHGDREAVEKEETLEALRDMKDAGIDLADFAEKAAAPEAREARAQLAEAKKEAEATAADSDRSVSVRRKRQKAIARTLTITPRDDDGNPTGDAATFIAAAILEQYDAMDDESAAWVDAQVDFVWDRAIPTDAEKKR